MHRAYGQARLEPPSSAPKVDWSGLCSEHGCARCASSEICKLGPAFMSLLKGGVDVPSSERIAPPHEMARC